MQYQAAWCTAAILSKFRVRHTKRQLECGQVAVIPGLDVAKLPTKHTHLTTPDRVRLAAQQISTHDRKPPFRVTDELVRRWVAEVWPEKTNNDYRSWLNIRDVPGIGCATRVVSPISGKDRVLQLMSQLEYRVLLLIEQMPGVVDIREQFPLLPLGRTGEIAERLGIKHSTYPKTNVWLVMTTDLVLTRQTQTGALELLPFYVKPQNNLDPSTLGGRRTLNKLEIEKQYWKERGSDLVVATEYSLSDTRFWNLDFLRGYWVRFRLEHSEIELGTFAKTFYCEFSPFQTLGTLIRRCAQQLHLTVEHAFTRFALSTRAGYLQVDLDHRRLVLTNPVKLIKGCVG